MRQLHVIDHPLITHKMSILRDHTTDPPLFRELVGQIAQMLVFDATRDLATDMHTIQTPLELTQARQLRLPLAIIPILRAGLAMAEAISKLIPQAKIGHLGMYRDEENLTPVQYYEKLPSSGGWRCWLIRCSPLAEAPSKRFQSSKRIQMAYRSA